MSITKVNKDPSGNIPLLRCAVSFSSPAPHGFQSWTHQQSLLVVPKKKPRNTKPPLNHARKHRTQAPPLYFPAHLITHPVPKAAATAPAKSERNSSMSCHLILRNTQHLFLLIPDSFKTPPTIDNLVPSSQSLPSPGPST